MTIPSHLSAILKQRLAEPPMPRPEPVVRKEPIKQVFLGKSALTSDPERSLVSARWDANARLILQFDDGQKITTDPAPIAEHIEQHVSIGMNPMFDVVKFNTLATAPLHEEGLLFYDNQDHSLCYYNDETDVTLNIGREQLVRVYNNTGSAILNGKIVYVSGATTGWPTVTLARANSQIDVEAILGMVTADIEVETYGYVCISGVVHDVDTTAYPVGTILYLSADTAGAYTGTMPVQPNYAVEIGTVIAQGTTTGDVLVHVDRKPWFPSIEIIDTATSTALPTTPTIFKPSTIAYNDGFSYDSATGEISINTNASYSINITFNAMPSASNKNIYFYVEEFNGSTWSIKQYSGRQLRLPNQEETIVGINASRYYVKGTRLRFYIWGDATVDLHTTNLPGTTPGTVLTPAYRFLMAG